MYAVVQLGPILQMLDINHNLFTININCNYVHKRQETANLRLIGELAIDLDQSKVFVRWGPDVQMIYVCECIIEYVKHAG